MKTFTLTFVVLISMLTVFACAPDKVEYGTLSVENRSGSSGRLKINGDDAGLIQAHEKRVYNEIVGTYSVEIVPLCPVDWEVVEAGKTTEVICE